MKDIELIGDLLVQIKDGKPSEYHGDGDHPFVATIFVEQTTMATVVDTDSGEKYNFDISFGDYLLVHEHFYEMYTLTLHI